MAEDSCREKSVDIVRSSNKKYFNRLDHVVRKRCPPRSVKRNNDIYITNKSNFQGQLAHCEKLIENGENEIILHGLGAAIPRTVNLALQLNEKLCGTFDMYTETGTVQVVDDIEPLTDLAEADIQTRQNSAIHIQLIRTASCGRN